MASQTNEPLPDGYQLHGYTIEKLLSSGGFSIVYLARDENATPVAIKEYLPSALVLRTGGAEVKVNADQNLAVFKHGLKCFFEEGRALAMVSHPNIVRVENFFRANETVYMVMQYVRGRTLQFHIQRHRAEFTESFIRRMFSVLLNGLREVHTNKLVHLDIKPANIYVAMDGKPVLLDFGAARQALTGAAQQLRPMYTAGYAAPEQYRSFEELGPWSDIYGIGATLYCCIAGTAPQPANEREKSDNMAPLRALASQAYSDELFTIIDVCLKLDPLVRFQSAYDLQKALRNADYEVPTQSSQSTPADAADEPREATITNRIRATLTKRLF